MLAKGPVQVRDKGRGLCGCVFFSTHGRSTAGLADSAANGCFAGCMVRRFTSFGIRGQESVGQVRHFLPELLWIAGLLAHVSRVRGWAGPNEAEFRRLLWPVWQAESQRAQEAQRGGFLRRLRTEEFATACSSLWWTIVRGLRSGVEDRRGCAWGAGAGQKAFELKTDSRFHWQGRWVYLGWPERRSQRKGWWAGPRAGWSFRGSNADAGSNPSCDRPLPLNARGRCAVVRGAGDWF